MILLKPVTNTDEFSNISSLLLSKNSNKCDVYNGRPILFNKRYLLVPVYKVQDYNIV